MERIHTVLQEIFGFLPDWLIGLGLVCFAILCALSLHRFLASTAKRDRAKTIDRGPGPGNDIRTEQARGLPRGRRRRAAIGAAE
jgi:hypothetical protein